MGKLKDFRDAITGHYMKKEEAQLHPDTSVAETRTPRKPRKPRKKKEVIPESGIDNETPEQRAFRMKMDVVFKGCIYSKENKEKLPTESQEYLMQRSEDWIDEGK